MFTPSNKSLTSLAFARIRNDILLGVLRPSERLKIQALSEHYGIGATAVREALSRLVTDGLVETEDQKGFCVGAVSREDLIDLTLQRGASDNVSLIIVACDFDTRTVRAGPWRAEVAVGGWGPNTRR